MKSTLAMAALCGLMAIPAVAGELLLSAGQTNPTRDRGDRDLSIGAEARTDTLGQIGAMELSLGGGAMQDGLDSLWVGGGVNASLPVAGNWFVEGSVMPGYYDFQKGVNTKDDLTLRSRVGVGYRLPSGDGISVAFDQKSGTGAAPERVGLQYHHSFGY